MFATNRKETRKEGGDKQQGRRGTEALEAVLADLGSGQSITVHALPKTLIVIYSITDFQFLILSQFLL